MKIAIIKYKAGNVQSVMHALKRLGYQAWITDDEKELKNADRIIFPGVGHAKTAMNSLEETGLHQIIPELQQPVLGICVGMQLLCKYSEEGNTNCLGIFDTPILKFNAGNDNLKIPHTGWNNIRNYKTPLFYGLAEDAFVYYVHSYFVPENNYTIATSDYAVKFSAAICKDNFFGVQFHSEKSASVGDQILKNFLEISI